MSFDDVTSMTSQSSEEAEDLKYNKMFLTTLRDKHTTTSSTHDKQSTMSSSGGVLCTIYSIFVLTSILLLRDTYYLMVASKVFFKISYLL